MQRTRFQAKKQSLNEKSLEPILADVARINESNEAVMASVNLENKKSKVDNSPKENNLASHKIS